MEIKKPKENKNRAGIWAGAFSVLTGIAVWLALTLNWQASLWSNLNMDEIFAQFMMSIEGTGNGMVTDYVRKCVIPSLAVTATVALTMWLLRRKREALWRLAAKLGAAVSFCAVIGVLAYGFILLDVVGFLEGNVVSSDYIETNYVDPRSVQITFPEKKRNLIYIWLESMESTYADKANGGDFDRNPIPELTEIAENGVSFTGTQGGVNGGYAAYGSTWTAGALFAHTSGLPLKIPIADSAMDQQEHFFTGATAIGDILAENGYQQALLIGSDAVFGGRRNYFTQHGNYAIWDYVYSKQQGQIPEDYLVWWGYEDEKLFTFAKEHLTEMAASDQPFNLSILTVDTHFPDGYVCPDCGDAFGEDRYSNVMACSSRKVAAFIQWIQEQPFYEDTTIVLSGDHLTMDVDYCDSVDADYPRRVYTTIINADAQVEDPTAYRTYTTMDNFPTTLAALGVDIEGDRLGLGTNLFSTQQTLLERDGLELMNRELRKQSDFLDSLSGISEEVYARSEEFLNTHVELEVSFQEDSMTYTLNGLSEIEDSFSSIEIFADKMHGERRSTVWNKKAERQPDGSYTATMPLEKVKDVDPFSIHFYAMTEDGRIKVDQGYSCSVSEKTLVYQPYGP